MWRGELCAVLLLGKRQTARPRLRWEDNIKLDLKGIEFLKARSEFIWLR
jgi:hypothetical protein